MGRGNSTRARHPGAAKRLWALLMARPMGDEFMTRDIVSRYPEFAVGTFPLKGVGKAIGHLINQGGVEVVARRRMPGETAITCVYRRCADHLSAPVRREPAPAKRPGLREIRFPDTWKPFRDGERKARWLGYASSLAGIE